MAGLPHDEGEPLTLQEHEAFIRALAESLELGEESVRQLLASPTPVTPAIIEEHYSLAHPTAAQASSETSGEAREVTEGSETLRAFRAAPQAMLLSGGSKLKLPKLPIWMRKIIDDFVLWFGTTKVADAIGWIIKKWPWASDYVMISMMKQGLLVQEQTYSNAPDHSYSREWYIRTLPPRKSDPNYKQTPSEIVRSIFTRQTPGPEENNNSCLLWPWFAQWFVEEFFKTGKTFTPDIEEKDHECQRTWSGHQIDLSTLYGGTPERTKVLRSGVHGKLRSQFLPNRHGINEEYPLYFTALTPEEQEACPMFWPDPSTGQITEAQIKKLFALGHPRQNLHPGLMLMTTIFLREHNRVCNLLVEEYKDSKDDDWYFDKARSILVGLLLKTVINDYIEHINPQKNLFHFDFKPELLAEIPEWDATPENHRIAEEFNLLYRWHAVIPDTVVDNQDEIPTPETFWDTDYLVHRGTSEVVRSAVSQHTNHFGAHASPKFLQNVDIAGVKQAREFMRLQSYNSYLNRFNVTPATSFKDINPAIAHLLAEAYDSPDDVEYYVGIMNAEVKTGIFPVALTKLVLAHAMHGIFSNELVQSRTAWGPTTFDPNGVGFAVFQGTNVPSLVSRNCPGLGKDEVAFTVKPRKSNQ